MRWELLLPSTFIGLDNWARMGADPLFMQSLKVTVVYILMNVPLTLVASFFLALLMNL